MDDKDTRDFEHRLSKLEEWRITVDIDRARKDESALYIREKLESLEKNINEFKGRIDTMSQRFLWAIATPIITALVGFILSGGLKSITQ